jgi:hypothetical protein
MLLGLIAELVMRTYYESQDKKTYAIREVVDLIAGLLGFQQLLN